MPKQKQKTIFVHNMFSTCIFLVLKSGINEQSVVILWVNWLENECFWHRFLQDLSHIRGFEPQLHSMMGWELLKNKGGSISFQNPFLLCPSSLWLGIRTQSVLGTCITNFRFRFLLHRINYCIVVFEILFLPIIVDWIWP